MTSETKDFIPSFSEILEYKLWRMCHRAANIQIPSCSYINDYTTKSVWSNINKHTCWPTMGFENSVTDSIKNKIKIYEFGK